MGVKVKAQAIACPNCGGQVQLRGFANTLTAVCSNCATVLDCSTPSLRILHRFQERQIRVPAIPLGSRGKLGETVYEVTGFQVRAAGGDEAWEWGEYVLFNPYKGYLYLTEYQGHWNVVRPVYGVPEGAAGATAQHAVNWRGRRYRHFQRSTARTIFVLGEFPWRVHVGETVTVQDYTAPPFVLSAEHTSAETTWSEGDYVEGARIWKIFGLKGSAPSARGIYVNQPSPFKGDRGVVIKLCALLELAVLLLLFFFLTFDRMDVVLNETHQFAPAPNAEQAFVTPVFELRGHTSNVEIQTRTNVDNQSVYMNYALIDADSGHAYDFGREVSYYHGRDSDGNWTEGGPNDQVMVPSVPAGRYYLRVEPEGDPRAAAQVTYNILVRRNVPNYTFYLIAALLIPIPAIFIVWRGYRFEYDRWRESDHAK